MQKVVPGITRASSRGNAQEQICPLSVPAFWVFVGVKLCDDHKLVIRTCNDPLNCTWLPRCWGTQLKSGNGKGEKPHRRGANRLVACTKISQVVLPGADTILNRKSQWCHVGGTQTLDRRGVLRAWWHLAHPNSSSSKQRHRLTGLCCSLGRNSQAGAARVLTSNSALL